MSTNGSDPLGAPPPPEELRPESFATLLYEAMAPVTREDAYYYWSLLILCNAIGTMYQLVDEWVRDTEAGPGWSPLVDLERCPSETLDWLGQFVGVRMPTSLTDEQKRAWIKDAPGFRRGRPATMIAAVKETLTGSQSVSLVERDGDPYYLTVATSTTETPDPDATMRAILSQKPAGIVLGTRPADLAIQTWDSFKTKAPNWAGEKTRYATWTDGLWDNPV